MPRSNYLKNSFRMTIFLILFNAIVSNAYTLTKSRKQTILSFFGVDTNGSVPEFKPIESRWSNGQNSLRLSFYDSGSLLTTTLQIVEDQNLISAASTGIFFADRNTKAYHNVTYTPKPDIFDSIGEFVFYQHVNDLSAVTTFRDSRGNVTYFGTIKKHYRIKTVPKNLEQTLLSIINERAAISNNSKSTVAQNNITSLRHIIFRISDEPQQPLLLENHTRYFTFPQYNFNWRNLQGATNIRLPKVVYPKVLISLNYDLPLRKIFHLFFIKEFIAHLNIVDMLYRQLSDPKIRLTITGIIIPRDALATPYIKRNTVSGVGDVFEVTNTYFRKENHRFPWDTYDILSIVTKTSMFNIVDAESLNTINGQSVGSACLTNYHKAMAFNVFDTKFESALSLAQSIGNLIWIDTVYWGLPAVCRDPYVTEPTPNATSTWPLCLQPGFQKFFRSKPATCMNNKPNKVPDNFKIMPGSWLSNFGQCQNIYKNATDLCMKELVWRSCNYLPCWVDGTCRVTINPRPLEGSQCSNDRRCINKTCELV